MYGRERDLAQAYVERKLGRRELIDRIAKLGLSAAALGFLVNAAGSRALAASGPDFTKYKGQALRVLLSKRPCAEAVVANLDNFRAITGLEVTCDLFPEDVYFDKVTAALSSETTQYDVFMTGAYHTWQYGPAGWLVDMAGYVEDPAMTGDAYHWDDILPQLRSSTAWSGVPGEPLGGKGAKQWAMPLSFEMTSVSYNRDYFTQAGLNPPDNLQEMIEAAVHIQQKIPGIYGIGVRGSRSWATIHPGYLSGYVSYGASDFTNQDGKLKAAVNSPQAKAFTRMWIDMIQKAGPAKWTTYTWREVGNDLGAGASAMIFDADILGFFQNSGTKEAGKIGYHAFTANPQAKEPTPNVWIWSLAMSNVSKNKAAAWYFIQWATGPEHGTYASVRADGLNPVRQSVWNSADFQTRLEAAYPGYLEQYRASASGSKIYFTPQPLFFNLTNEWAAALQRMHAKEISVDDGLDQLAVSVDRQLKEAGID